MNIIIRKYTEEDLPQMIQIWNEVVEDGIAFPQEDLLTADTGKVFFLQVRLLVPLRRMLIREKFMACIFCIPIMWVDAVISAMPAMPFVKMHAACTLGKSWCRIVWCKERHTVLESCNLMRSLLRTFMPGICMNGWDLCSLA